MYLTVLGGLSMEVSIHSGELLREYMAHLYACKVHDYMQTRDVAAHGQLSLGPSSPLGVIAYSPKT